MRLLTWLAKAVLPSRYRSNHNVKLSERELLALQREDAESQADAMGETVKPAMMYDRGNPRSPGPFRYNFRFTYSDAMQVAVPNTKLDGTKIEQPEEMPRKEKN